MIIDFRLIKRRNINVLSWWRVEVVREIRVCES